MLEAGLWEEDVPRKVDVFSYWDDSLACDVSVETLLVKVLNGDIDIRGVEAIDVEPVKDEEGRNWDEASLALTLLDDLGDKLELLYT
jgi:hypothetical protein